VSLNKPVNKEDSMSKGRVYWGSLFMRIIIFLFIKEHGVRTWNKEKPL
jgi:hypothetical protein